MSSSFLTNTTTEQSLLHLLRQTLKQSAKANAALSLPPQDWQQLLTLSDRHEVLTLLETTWNSAPLPNEQRLRIQAKTARTIQKSIQLQALNARLTALLANEGMPTIILF